MQDSPILNDLDVYLARCYELVFNEGTPQDTSDEEMCACSKLVNA